MDIQEYKDLSNVTMADVFHANDTKTQRLLHAACGLVTETGELLESIDKSIGTTHYLDPINVKEELGDITWYLAIDMREFNYTIALDSVDNFRPVNLSAAALYKNAVQATIIATKIMDDLKRVTFYGKNFLDETFQSSTPEKADAEMKEMLDFRKKHIQRCKDLSVYILNIANSFGLKYSDIFDTNIAKLKKRYGNKFDSYKALNRDLTQEYKVLEQDNSNVTNEIKNESTSVFAQKNS